MKLKYFLSSLLAGLALITVGCSDDDEITTLDELQVSKSFVSIAMTGGSSDITVTAKESWAFDETTIPEWLTISPLKGNAGETKVTFTAPETLSGKGTIAVQIKCADKIQNINVIQGQKKAEPSTCAQVIAGADGKTYRVTGICTKIANTQYGNWYLEDATGEVYIYGTLDKNGVEMNFLSWDLEVGDEVTVEGPKTTYGSVIELVNVSVVSIKKSLVKVDPTAVSLNYRDTSFVTKLVVSGAKLTVTTDADWLGAASYDEQADTTYVTFHALENTETETRTATITYKSTTGSTSSSVTTTVAQAGAPVDITDLSTIIALADNASFVAYNDTVVAASSTSFIMSDGKNLLYVYKPDKVAAPGDIVTVSGVKTTYVIPEATASTVTVVANGKEFATPVAKDVTGIADTYKLSTLTEYVSFNGNLSVSGDYYNVTLPGTTATQGSLKDLTDAQKAMITDKSDIFVAGYYVGNSSKGKYLNLVIDAAFNIFSSTVADFNAASVDKTKYYKLTGEITKIDKEAYGNFHIKDATGETYIYGMAPGYGGSNKKFSTLGLKVGDTVSLICTRGEYKGTIEGLSAIYLTK